LAGHPRSKYLLIRWNVLFHFYWNMIGGINRRTRSIIERGLRPARLTRDPNAMLLQAYRRGLGQLTGRRNLRQSSRRLFAGDLVRRGEPMKE
jgi:hypothetical protein